MKNNSSTGVMSVAQMSVTSAISIVNAMENDIRLTRSVLQQKKQVNQDLEELVWLLKEENHQLAEQLAAVTEEYNEYKLNIFSSNESLILEAEEAKLVSEGELERALVEHERTSCKLVESQNDIRELKQALDILNNNISSEKQKSREIEAKMAEYELEINQLKEECTQHQKYSKILEEANREMAIYHEERNSRYAQNKVNDFDSSDVTSEMMKLRARIRELEFENTVLKVSVDESVRSNTKATYGHAQNYESDILQFERSLSTHQQDLIERRVHVPSFHMNSAADPSSDLKLPRRHVPHPSASMSSSFHDSWQSSSKMADSSIPGSMAYRDHSNHSNHSNPLQDNPRSLASSIYGTQRKFTTSQHSSHETNALVDMDDYQDFAFSDNVTLQELSQD